MQNKRKFWKIISLISFLFIFTNYLFDLSAQDWARPWTKNQQRIDLRTLGYPDVNEIPSYNSAITSLITARNGLIYGGTTGENAYLFFFDPVKNKVRQLGQIPNQESIHHSLAEDSEGNIYIGTGRNMFREIDLTPEGYWEYVNESLLNDITSYFQQDPGGRLYRYNPEISNDNIKLPDMNAEVEDLGIPVANNSIYALTNSPDGSVIYGITYPDGKFFLYNINEDRFEIIGTIDENIIFHGPERFWRSISRDLICDEQGRVYFSGARGELKYYCPITKSFQSTGQIIPGDYYPAQFYTHYTVAEYFDRDKAGLIYGGTSDGYLFVFDPEEMELRNLGKPRADRRIRCLAVGDDGKVYLIAGESPLTSSVSSKLYVYDPANPGFVDYGMLIVDRSPHYYRQGRQFDSMTKGIDGTIFLGESEYRSSLFLLIPPL